MPNNPDATMFVHHPMAPAVGLLRIVFNSILLRHGWVAGATNLPLGVAPHSARQLGEAILSAGAIGSPLSLRLSGDASTIPAVISINTNAPTIMVAEKGAVMIKRAARERLAARGSLGLCRKARGSIVKMLLVSFVKSWFTGGRNDTLIPRPSNSPRKLATSSAGA